MKEQGAEAYFTEKFGETPKVQFAWSKGPMCEFAESYHQHRLNAITDEDIEGIIIEAYPNTEGWHDLDREPIFLGAKALLNSLKGIQ